MNNNIFENRGNPQRGLGENAKLMMENAIFPSIWEMRTPVRSIIVTIGYGNNLGPCPEGYNIQFYERT